MYAKLMALVPLLGWFYLGVAGIFALVLIFRITKHVRLGKLIEKYIFVIVGAWMLMLSIQNLNAEFELFPESKKSFKDTAESKIEHEIGGFYTKYYKAFRPYVSGKLNDVNLIGADSKEFHYARMYLYPTVVLEATSTHDGNTRYHIVPENMLGSIENYKEITRADGKVLIETPEL